MQKQKIARNRKIDIPAMHTYLIKQFQFICDEFQISLLSGNAEVNGLQIKKNYPHKYQLPCSIPVYTWEGCTIVVDWKEEESERTSDEEWCDLTQNNYNAQSPMIRYLEIHYQLTTLRKLALQKIKQGPRLAIVGGESTGIQNATSLLLNYTGKLNMKPIYVDLDTQNSIFIDGSICSIVYEYGKMESLFERSDKLTYFYGNRKLRKQSFLNQAKLLSDAVNKKLTKQLKSYKEKGSSDEYPSFCSGMILRCPKIRDKEDKKFQKELLADLVRIYDITHLVIIDNSEFSAYIGKSSATIERYNTVKLEGTESFLQLPRPLKSKIQRYFDPELQLNKPLVLKISDITLYQLIELINQPSFCRIVNITDQPIVKSTIAILHAKNSQQFDKHQVAQKVQTSPICCLAFIYKISNGEITLHVTNDAFWEQCRDKIWVTTITESQV